MAIHGARAADAGRETERFDLSASNLLVVLRESPGANKQDETLRPYGKITARMPDGREIQFEASWFHYLGDMQLRLEFRQQRTHAHFVRPVPVQGRALVGLPAAAALARLTRVRQ